MIRFLFLLRRTLITIVGVLLFCVNGLAQSNDDCLMCHDDDSMTMEKNGKEISIAVSESEFGSHKHANLKCVSCHVNFDPEEMPHSDNLTPKNCADCHQKDIVKHLFHPRLLKYSPDKKGKDVDCKNCHGFHYVSDPNAKGSKWSMENIPSSCGNCHKEEKEKYLKSSHFAALTKGITSAPNCLVCHKNPVAKIHSPKDSLSVKIEQEKLCLSCHLDDPTVRARVGSTAGFITQYEKSVHGSALNSGNFKAANCINCHGSHSVIIGSNSESSVYKLNIPQTCGKCHSEISKEYNQSIHGEAIKKGITDAPACTNCHGEHNILKHNNPKSPVAFQNVSTQVCTPCHESVRLSEKYGLASNRFETFTDSYHGLALRGGSAAVANCGSCHGVHNIKPSSDPTSSVNKNNLVKTCGTCHPGANTTFTTGKIHVTLEEADEPILYWISTTYILLLITVLGGMFIHNALDFYRKSKIKKLKQAGLIKSEYHGHSLYLRMTLGERIQHATMGLSFIVLVITGFMLRFPDSWWVEHIRDLSSHAFVYRSWIHRIAAVIMIAVSLYHIYYVFFTERGKQLIRDLFPKYQDLKDAIAVAKFNLGISKEKPKLDRFSYIEKAEYWALVWGTIVMSLTGLLMWVYIDYVGTFTKLDYDIARTIHYFEAWLAFLAIVIWHFYFVIFNPEVYPMNTAWLKGTISEEEMAEEHPKELERINQKENENPEKD